ncbi:MAG: hypothetical protein AB7S81_01635 [Bdellovibrionales bacterium]
MPNAIKHRSIVDQITSKTDKRFELVARMADFIVEMKLDVRTCEQQDLHIQGFNYQDVAALWHFANALAAIEFRCRENEISASCGREVRYA